MCVLFGGRKNGSWEEGVGSRESVFFCFFVCLFVGWLVGWLVGEKFVELRGLVFVFVFVFVFVCLCVREKKGGGERERQGTRELDRERMNSAACSGGVV